nr:hypothetical protein [Tanacetum cinerariifolium]
MDASGGSGSNSPVWPIVDNNSIVDMNGTMDNLEERIENPEMVFAYLKNKKMLERQENKPNRADEDIAKLEVASKSKGFTSKTNKWLGSPDFYYVYNPSTNMFKRLSQLENSHDVSILYATGVLRMAFDPTKLHDYKVVQLFACLHAELEIQVYSSETGNWSLCRDKVSYYNFCHFATLIYYNDAFHWLETEDRQLTLYKFHIDDDEHTTITTSEFPNGLHQGSNFLQSFGGREGSHDPIDDIDSKEFTIYEMVKGVMCGQLEREEDTFLVINISGKVVKYNIISKTISLIFDIVSNEMDDEYELFPAYKVDHKPYEFILSFTSV